MQPSAVFVYGTLKSDEVRGRVWPVHPQTLTSAVVRGRLFDLGPYPALLEGEDRILGELRTFRPDEMNAVLHVLDKIEGYHKRRDDLYVRKEVDCETEPGQIVRAFAFFYRDVAISEHARRLTAGEDGLVQWSGHKKTK